MPLQLEIAKSRRKLVQPPLCWKGGTRAPAHSTWNGVTVRQAGTPLPKS